MVLIFFFFNDTATTEIYTLSLHDALPISFPPMSGVSPGFDHAKTNEPSATNAPFLAPWEVDWCQRSEEHTSELQSRLHLVCRLLLEKKKFVVNQQSQAPAVRIHGHRPTID